MCDLGIKAEQFHLFHDRWVCTFVLHDPWVCTIITLCVSPSVRSWSVISEMLITGRGHYCQLIHLPWNFINDYFPQVPALQLRSFPKFHINVKSTLDDMQCARSITLAFKLYKLFPLSVRNLCPLCTF